MLQRYVAATYVGRMCPGACAQDTFLMQGRQGIQEHICYTKGRSWSWGGCMYIYIYTHNQP